MNNKLKDILDFFPLPGPDRVTEEEDIVLAEWHKDGNYFEIEISKDKIYIMSEVNNVFKHWILRRDDV